MRVVAFTGLPGSGKTAAVAVAEGRGIPVVRMGDLVWEETRARGLPLTADRVGEVAKTMRREKGEDVWAVRTLDRLRGLEFAVTIVDGVRGLAEVDTFRRALGSAFVLVALHASPEERYARIRARGRTDDTVTRTAFEERDRRELEFGIGTAIALADVLLVNEGPIDALEGRVAELLDRLATG